MSTPEKNSKPCYWKKVYFLKYLVFSNVIQAKNWGMKGKRKLESYLITNSTHKLCLYQAKQIFSLTPSMVRMFPKQAVTMRTSSLRNSCTLTLWFYVVCNKTTLGVGAREGRISISSLLWHLTIISVPNMLSCCFVFQSERPRTSSSLLLERHKAGREVLPMNKQHEMSGVSQQPRSRKRHPGAWCFNFTQAKAFRST